MRLDVDAVLTYDHRRSGLAARQQSCGDRAEFESVDADEIGWIAGEQGQTVRGRGDQRVESTGCRFVPRREAATRPKAHADAASTG